VTQITADELREEIYNFALAIAENAMNADTTEKVDKLRYDCFHNMMTAINLLYDKVEN
jgi:hypothetical protein